MLTDARGLEVATDAPQVIEVVDAFSERFLGFQKNAAVILDALKVDPYCVIANAYAAALQLLVDRLGGEERARSYLDAARSRARSASGREREFLAAVEAWSAGDLVAAAGGLEAILDRFPRDLVVLRFAQILHFKRGDSQGLLRIAEKVFQANADSSYVHGILAFGYEECHRYAEAEATGQRGVEMNRNDIGSQHAVTHALEMQGRFEEALAWIEGFADTWEHATTESLSHLWWHAATYRLELDDPGGALEVFDTLIWGEDKHWGQDKDLSRFPINPINLLWRTQMYGADVGGRWRAVAARIVNRSRDPADIYPSLLYLYCLCKGECDVAAAEMLQSIEDRARTSMPHDRQAWVDIAVPLARSVVAYARDDLEQVWCHLAPISRRSWSELGHSHLQRDIFSVMWLDTLMRTARWEEAAGILWSRGAAPNATRWTLRQLARASEVLGSADERA